MIVLCLCDNSVKHVQHKILKYKLDCTRVDEVDDVGATDGTEAAAAEPLRDAAAVEGVALGARQERRWLTGNFRQTDGTSGAGLTESRAEFGDDCRGSPGAEGGVG